MAKKNMPVLFVGHGSPTNALEKNDWTAAWEQLARRMPTPKAILCISAHWLREGSAVTAMERPKTIHDFYGFPAPLNRVEYPAPGSPALARDVQKAVKVTRVALDTEWGLDHGCWSVLVHMYPDARVPVVQLSLDYELSLADAVALGEQLQSLRTQGVLILGSGNIVHNLSLIQPRGGAFPWAVAFDEAIRKDVRTKNARTLATYTRHQNAELAQPTNDHFLPLLYAAGAAGSDTPEFFNTDIALGSVSMTGVAWGLK